jgi:hypothetical protein
MYRRQLRILFIQRFVIITLTLALLITVLRIWKFEGKGANEWHTEYQMAIYENERLVRCIQEYDSEPYFRRQEGVTRFCKL